MHTPVEVQMWRLSVLFLLGTVTNVLFHIYTAWRGTFNPRKIGRHLGDAAAAMGFLVTFATVLFIINHGEIRAYVPISICMGFFTSHVMVGEQVYTFSYKVFSWLRKTMGNIYSKISPPPEPPEEPK